jgi:hypothetical protein
LLWTNLVLIIHFERIYLIVTKLYNILKFVIMHVWRRKLVLCISYKMKYLQNVTLQFSMIFQTRLKITPSNFESCPLINRSLFMDSKIKSLANELSTLLRAQLNIRFIALKVAHISDINIFPVINKPKNNIGNGM